LIFGLICKGSLRVFKISKFQNFKSFRNSKKEKKNGGGVETQINREGTSQFKNYKPTYDVRVIFVEKWTSKTNFDVLLTLFAKNVLTKLSKIFVSKSMVSFDLLLTQA